MRAFLVLVFASSALANPVLRRVEGAAVVGEVGDFSSEEAQPRKVLMNHGGNYGKKIADTALVQDTVGPYHRGGPFSLVNTSIVAAVTDAAAKSALRVRQVISGVGALVTGVIGEIVTTFQNITGAVGSLGGAPAAAAPAAGGDG